MSKPGPNLRGIQLTRSFGSSAMRAIALRDISLDLHEGEFTLLMGPSGCGKSTLLAILGGLLRPDSGRVLVWDKDLGAQTDRERRDFRRRHFGFIFQGHNLMPTLTAQEQLEMLCRWEGMSAQEAHRHAARLLDGLGLAGKGCLLPQALSGGEKQRVAVARALLKKPSFCFADEPTSALDWGNGQHVIELLHRATRTGRATVLVATHDARLIPYADRVIHLEDGKRVAPADQEGARP